LYIYAKIRASVAVFFGLRNNFPLKFFIKCFGYVYVGAVFVGCLGYSESKKNYEWL